MLAAGREKRLAASTLHEAAPLLLFTMRINYAMQGMMTVRAYRVQAAHTATQAKLLQDAIQIFVPQIAVNRWLSVRIETLGTAVVCVAAITSTIVLPRRCVLGLVLGSCRSFRPVTESLVCLLHVLTLLHLCDLSTYEQPGMHVKLRHTQICAG